MPQLYFVVYVTRCTTWTYSTYMDIKQEDLVHLIRDKYNGQLTESYKEDLARLTAGEPLAYVIGWLPFLGLRIRLDSLPLIPRPETEWWAEVLIEHLKERESVSVLDLCAGSGAIGLSVLAGVPGSSVTFAELSPLHSALIAMNIEENKLAPERATILSGDLFVPVTDKRFDVIATNPPYIPDTRELDASVREYEPLEALYAGSDGLDLIRSIIEEAPDHLNPSGELWMECDTSNIEEAATLMRARGFRDVEIRTDLYSRPRVVVGYFG